MADWNDIIVEALKELRADAVFTRGAILHSKVSEIARRAGLDLDRPPTFTAGMESVGPAPRLAAGWFGTAKREKQPYNRLPSGGGKQKSPSGYLRIL